MRKKIFSLLTTLVMVVGLVGAVPAYAEDIVNNKSALATNGQWRDGYIGYSDNDYEYDYYPIYISTAGKLTINMQSFGDLEFHVLDSDYDEIGSYSPGGSAGSPKNAYFSRWLEKGTYYVRVREKWGYIHSETFKGSYRVKASFTSAKSNEKEPNDTYLQAQPVSNGSTITGTMTYYDEYDYYKINVSKKMEYNFYVYAYDRSIVFTLYDSNLNTIINNEYTYQEKPNKFTCTLNKGTYYIRINEGGLHSYPSSKYILKFNPPAKTKNTRPSNPLIKPSKVSSVKLKKGGKRTVKVTWKKVAGASGYQVKWAANKKFKKAKKKFTKKNSITLKKLKKKKYYVKVRAYKTANGKKIYGKWSRVKAVRR